MCWGTVYASHCNLYNTFVYSHKYLPLVLRGKYNQYYVECFEDKQIQKKELLVDLT